MSKVLVNNSSLADIAAAIREKNESNTKYKPAEMGAAIREIESGGGVDYLEKRLIGEPYDYYNDKITKLAMYAFYEDRAVRSVHLPNVVTLETNSLSTRTIEKITLNNVIDAKELRACRNLWYVDLPKATNIAASAFNEDYILKAVVLRNTNLVTLANVNAFNNCYHILGTTNSTYNPTGAKDGFIYVPKALIETYKAATNWVTFASQFRALEDYTVDGTITGALDESKIAA